MMVVKIIRGEKQINKQKKADPLNNVLFEQIYAKRIAEGRKINGDTDFA